MKTRQSQPTSPAPAKLAGYDGYHHYLPIRDEIFHGGIYVTSAGHGVVHPGAQYPPVQHPQLYHFHWQDGRVLPEFAFILITAGEGVFESKATGAVRITPGTGILLFPGVWHRYRPTPATGWTEKWVQFNGEFAHLLLNQKIISPERALLRAASSTAVESALDHLLARIDADPVSNSLQISLHALSVLTLTLGEPSAAPALPTAAARNAPDDPVVAAALDYIWTRGHRVLAVADVAAAVGVTRRTLERRMESVLGRSVLDEIIAVRFSRAERLLRETELPIKTVVVLAGFGSAENMRQVFLSRTRLAPADYRKNSAAVNQPAPHH